MAVLQYQKPKGLGQRHILVLAGFFGFVLSYSLRFNLSIAIVAMVRNHNNNENTSSISISKTILVHPDYACPHPYALSMYAPNTTKNTSDISFLSNLGDVNLASAPLSFETFNKTILEVDNENKTEGFLTKIIEIHEQEEGEFDWPESEQGLILGSFFWGYILTQIPGGYLGHRFGGKWPFGIGLLVAGLMSIITPFAAHNGGVQWLVFVRVIQGFAEGLTMPAMHGLLAKYIPPDERGKLAAFTYAGMPFGTAFSTIVNGYIIHYFGWHMVFYATGAATILWFCIWSFLVSSSPEKHPRISQKELKYIQNSIQGNSELQTGNDEKMPWNKVWTSGPFWAILICQTSESWGLYTIMTELPTYMKTVLHFDIKQNSLMSAFPHLLTWIVTVCVTQLGDFMITRRYLSTGFVRKSCNTLGLWGSSAALLGVAYSGCDRTITVTLLALSVAARGGIYGGVLVNLIDIAPNYAGVLMGITNTIAGAPGFLAPLVAGIIIDENPSIQQWRLVFLITIGIAFVGNLLFILMASGEEQSWNRQDDDKDNTGTNTNRSSTTLENPCFQNDGHFYTVHGPLAATLPMEMIIRTNDYNNERDVNDEGLIIKRISTT